MPTADEFKKELFEIMREAQRANRTSVEIEAGELHRRVGGYPGPDHRMPTCCGVMKQQCSVEYGDTVLEAPPGENGASLKIRYRLPRVETAELL